MSASLRRELDFITDLAREAGNVTLKYFQQDFETQWKADETPVTVADLEAEKLIRRRLEKTFPGDGILGEEEGETSGTSGRTWVIDPIDGTKSFVQGVPLYAVLIGLEIDGEPSVGAICLPALDELVVAARGEGCYWNERPARVSKVSRLEDACVLYTSMRNFTVPSSARVETRERLMRTCRMMRGWGDAYGYVLVATGRADVMLDPIVNPWDVGPMIPILEEAGGRFTDWTGQRTSRGKDAAGSNGILHDDLITILQG